MNIQRRRCSCNTCLTGDLLDGNMLYYSLRIPVKLMSLGEYEYLENTATPVNYMRRHAG
jgi:hypothetical protein